MAFQLRANETVADGIRRCARRELESALEDLGGNSRGPRGAGEKEAVHDVRKRFKKVRAALRLVREDLGDEVYRDENFRLRDAARPLTEVRDAQMLAETWAALTLELASELEPLAAAKVRDALLANEEDVTRRVLREEKAFAAVAEVATRTLGRLAEWRIDCDGWAALEGGLRRVYRTGHRALSLAAETPSVENLHEWRKQAKYLWHGLQLLEATWTEREQNLGNRVHELSRLLGDDHDLAVLRQTLAADPLPYGGHRVLKGILALVDRKREQLQPAAFTLGRQVYEASPEAFTSRMAEYWNAGTQGTEAAKPPARARLARGRSRVVSRGLGTK